MARNKRRYIPKGVKQKALIIRLTVQETELLKNLALNAQASVAGYVQSKIFPRAGYDLFAAQHPLTKTDI